MSLVSYHHEYATDTTSHTKIQLGKRNHVPYLDSFILKDLDFAALEPVNVVDEQIFERHYTNTNATLLPKDLQSLATSANDSDFNIVSTFIVNSASFLKEFRSQYTQTAAFAAVYINLGRDSLG